MSLIRGPHFSFFWEIHSNWSIDCSWVISHCQVGIEKVSQIGISMNLEGTLGGNADVVLHESAMSS
jgi:hypothetical protein